MCNILYYRFAVLAQFSKLIFSFFYNLKKNRCDFFLSSPVAVFFLFFCSFYVIIYLVMVE